MNEFEKSSGQGGIGIGVKRDPIMDMEQARDDMGFNPTPPESARPNRGEIVNALIISQNQLSREVQIKHVLSRVIEKLTGMPGLDDTKAVAREEPSSILSMFSMVNEVRSENLDELEHLASRLEDLI